MPARLKYDFLQKYFLEYGFELLDEEYKSRGQKLNLKDKNGYLYCLTFNQFDAGMRYENGKFSIFGKSNPYASNNISNWLFENGNKYLLEETYVPINEKRRIILVDNIGYRYDVDCAALIFYGKIPHIIDISNPFVLDNMRIWLRNNSKFLLAENNVYTGCSEKLSFYCDKGHLFLSVWDSILQGQGCGVCQGFQVDDENNLSFKYPLSRERWNYKKNDKNPEKYSPKSNKFAWWICENGIHNGYYRTISGSVNYEFRCPSCVEERRESFLQEKVRLYLGDLGHTVKTEFDCSIVPISPKTGRPMPFDNEVVELSLLIEVNGEQHYRVTIHTKKQAVRDKISPEDVLNEQKWRDDYKKEFALINGYEYLELPYKTDDSSETWKKLINEKIEEILKKAFFE